MREAKKLNNLRHSCAHLLAAAVMQLWPKTKLGIGPAIKDGFYYDFEFVRPLTASDLPKIEQTMRQLKQKGGDFIQHKLSIKKAKQVMADQPYKLELIDEFARKLTHLSFYQVGDFIDLCKGGHVNNVRAIGPFKLLSIAGSYWKGNEKNKMLTRIYGTCFTTQAELDEYLLMREQAKQRDHRQLGQKLELFTINENIGPGLVLWLPQGNIIREELENWAKATEKEHGYQHISTPHITKANLYYTSGHLPYYQADMFPPLRLSGEKEEYYLKPMNCPHHHMVYQAKARSYKELPLRLAEYGMCYRYESSGELFGLMRVRGLQINDAHIYCTQEQAVDEFVAVMQLHEYYYRTLGIKKYHLELALRDPQKTDKYHGNEKMWQQAETFMRQAVEKVKIKMLEEEGSAAFYGPKIDFIIYSSIGREFAVSTNQIDLFMGARFGLEYTDKNGRKQTPVIIHRAPLGSHERFIGFLIEHFGGAFPVWLHPLQVKILPLGNKFNNYAQQVNNKLKKELPNLRVAIDTADETLGKKIRQAQEEKVPYMLIVGQKETENNSVNLRLRTEEQIGTVPIKQFVDKIRTIINHRSLKLWDGTNRRR